MANATYRYRTAGPADADLENDVGLALSITGVAPPHFIDIVIDTTGKADLDEAMLLRGYAYSSTNPADALSAMTARACMSRTGSGQTIGSGATVEVDFDTSVFDTSSMINLTTNSFTVSAAGEYLVTAGYALQFAILQTGRIQLDVRVNGSAVVSASNTGLAGEPVSVDLCKYLSLAAGDVVTFAMSHGVAATETTVTGTLRPRAGISRCAPV